MVDFVDVDSVILVFYRIGSEQVPDRVDANCVKFCRFEVCG